MPTSVAFSPCNITGFFRIHNDHTDPLNSGSTGASLAISTGVTTRVTANRTCSLTNIRATFNRRPLGRDSVSEYLAKRLMLLDGRSWRVSIVHESSFPIGHGFGTSGAGALGLSLALNEILGLSLRKIEGAQIAHLAEIANKTGLGTVASVYSGGFTLRKSPGAPGIGRIDRLNLPSSLRIVTASFGPISTAKVLASSNLERRVNYCVDTLGSLDRRRAWMSFMDLGKKFTSCLGLSSPRLGRLIRRLDSKGFKSSMVMLGESVFAILPRDEIIGMSRCIREMGLVPTVARVATQGAHLM